MPKPCGKMLCVVMNGCGKKRILSSCLELDCFYLEDDYERDISEKEMFITNRLFFSSV